jgi:hypothetical protein
MGAWVDRRASATTLGGSSAASTDAPAIDVTHLPYDERVVALIASAGAEGRKVYLVAKGLGTDAPPETIYQLYLGLPQGTVPNPDGPYYVGALNFFNAVRGGAEAGRSDPRFLSFDVTRLLKSLQLQNALGDNAIVTIVPAGKPRANAKPIIGAISLVAQ